MSWLQDLAGRAEHMLNKLDQNAANVLQHSASTNDEEPLMAIKVVDEPQLSTPLPPTSLPNKVKRNILQLTPKKTQNEILSGIKKSNTEENLDDQDKKSVSSRRSSVTHESGSVIEKITDTAMQTSFTDTPVQLRLVELEEICNSLVAEKEFLVERNEILEQANAKNVQVISELEANVSKLMKNDMELMEKLEWAKKETNQAVMEMQQYRVRAQQTLQMKEKLIEQLKKGQSGGHEDGGSSNDALTLEIQQLKAEKQILIDESRNLSEKLEQSKEMIRKVEQKLDILPEKEAKIHELQEQLVKIGSKNTQIEEELNTQNREMLNLREEMMKQRSKFATQLSERETEILDLRSKLNQRKQQMSSNSNAEERISSLTHSLVQKQAALESTTAERNALRLQLEKLDTIHRASMMETRGGQRPLRIDVNETDDVKARIPIFLQENPFDTRLSRKMKRAYSNLDSVGVRIGTFLRRYPLARIMVIFYIVLLHLWVMVVLFTSTPN